MKRHVSNENKFYSVYIKIVNLRIEEKNVENEAY